MYIHLMILNDGNLRLAALLQDLSGRSIAVLAGGTILTNEEFYILPSAEEEIVSRRVECVQRDGFPTARLEELQRLLR